jgi:hypothetical protein
MQQQQPPAVVVAVRQSSWTESAYDWWQRSKRQHSCATASPKDPGTAAWAFCRPTSANGGTGIAFVDSALRRQRQQHGVATTTAIAVGATTSHCSLPVVDIRGDSFTGKTWTVVSLAARFAVATRQSQFPEVQEDDSLSPQVILLCSNYDVTVPKLSYAVRSMLLRKLSSSQVEGTAASQECTDPSEVFESDMNDCLSRIHIATAEDLSGWVPVLETIRQQLSQPASTDHPTVLLWDGFLSEPHQNEAARMEVVRQLERLLLECSILLITTTTGNSYRRGREWDRFVTHRIRLDRNDTGTTSASGNKQHEYMATVYGAQIPFSISSAGILS